MTSLAVAEISSLRNSNIAVFSPALKNNQLEDLLSSDDEHIGGFRAEWCPDDADAKAYARCIRLIMQEQFEKAQAIAFRLPDQFGVIARQTLGLVVECSIALEKGNIAEAKSAAFQCVVWPVSKMLRARLRTANIMIDDADDLSGTYPKKRRKVRVGSPRFTQLRAMSLKDRIRWALEQRMSNSPVLVEKKCRLYIRKIVDIGRTLGWEKYLAKSCRGTLPYNQMQLSTMFLLLRSSARGIHCIDPHELATDMGCTVSTVRSSVVSSRELLSRLGISVVVPKAGGIDISVGHVRDRHPSTRTASLYPSGVPVSKRVPSKM